MQGTSVLGKGWRVENDEVVGRVRTLAHTTFQELESILAESLVAGVAREVQLHVCLGQLNGLGTAVNAMHQLGTSTHSIEREASRIAEHIQHTLTTGIMLQQGTIPALVNKKARLLPFQPVNTELQAILRSDIIVAATHQKAVHIVSRHEGQRGLTLIINMLYAALHHLCKRFCYLLTAQMHTDGVRMHDSRLSIDIDYQAWQVVTFTVNQPEGFTCKSKADSKLESRLQA